MNTGHTQRESVDCRSDEQLMIAVQENDSQEAFSDLHNRHCTALLVYVQGFLHSHEDAEEASQLAWINIWNNRKKFDRTKKFQPWMYGVAKNAAIDISRKAQRNSSRQLDLTTLCPASELSTDYILATLAGTDREGEPIETLLKEERSRILQWAIDNLPDHQRCVLVKFWNGEKYTDIARALNIPLGTVKSRMHAAVQKIKNIFTQYASESQAAA